MPPSPRPAFRAVGTTSGWTIVCDDERLGFEAPGLLQTEQAARAEAARLDILYAC